MTIEQLAADPVFDPHDYLTRTPGGRPPQDTRCQVPGCGVPHAPGSIRSGGRIRVCGYCRAKVVALRANSLPTAS